MLAVTRGRRPQEASKAYASNTTRLGSYTLFDHDGFRKERNQFLIVANPV